MLVFNFHHVEPTIPDKRDPGRAFLSITPQGLRQFIRTFRLMGFRFCCMQDVLDAKSVEALGPKTVMITLDDGFLDNFKHGAPIFEAEACPALIFVLPGRFGGTNQWDHREVPEDQQDRLMSLSQMKQLAQSPWIRFGSHGLYHSHLPQLDPADCQAEINESYAILSRELGNAFLPVFAYPWGEYSEPVLAMMEQSPYKFAFTVEPRRWTQKDRPYQIPRYTAFSRDGNPIMLAAKLCRHRVLLG